MLLLLAGYYGKRNAAAEEARNKMRSKDSVYFVFFSMIIFCIFGYGIHRIFGFVIFPDEFGYWASAAAGAGYDWSGLTSLGSYYSYGYGLLLFPILKLFSDSVMAYRAAIAVNALLMCVSAVFIDRIVRIFFPKTEKVRLIFASGIAVFYPGFIFYMQMTLTEALLMFLYAAVCYQVLGLLERPGGLKAVMLALTLVYMYFVHMRTIGIIIACVLTLLLWMLKKPECRKKVFLFLGLLLVLGIIGLSLKEAVTGAIYSGASAAKLSANDYKGQWWKFADLISLQGMREFIIGCAGKLFYLGMASFGIFYWAVWHLAKNILVLFRKRARKEEAGAAEWGALFLLLTVIFQFLIAAVYMKDASRIDNIVYGRYNDFLLPVLLGIGVLEMLESKRLLKGTAVICTASAAAVPLINWLAGENRLEAIHGYFIVGISYLLNEKTTDMHVYFWQAYALGCLLCLGAGACVWLAGRKNNACFVLCLLIGLEIGLGIQASEHYVYYYNSINYSDMAIKAVMEEEALSERNLLYLHESGEAYASYLQFLMRDRPIGVITKEDIAKRNEIKNEILIAASGTSCRRELEKLYKECKETYSFLLFYN